MSLTTRQVWLRSQPRFVLAGVSTGIVGMIFYPVCRRRSEEAVVDLEVIGVPWRDVFLRAKLAAIVSGMTWWSVGSHSCTTLPW